MKHFPPLLILGKSFFISCLVELGVGWGRGDFWPISDEARKYTSCQLRGGVCVIGGGRDEAAVPNQQVSTRVTALTTVCAVSCFDPRTRQTF